MLNRYDVDKWLDDFMKAKKMLDEENIDRIFLKGRMNDGIYLATLVEHLMTLEEPDGVLEKARKRQTESLEQFRVGLEYHTDATHFGKAKGKSVTTDTADTPQTDCDHKCERYVITNDEGEKAYGCMGCQTDCPWK